MIAWSSYAGLTWALFVSSLLTSAVEGAELPPAHFDTNRVAKVEIRVSSSDWDELRYQHREAEFFPEEGVTPPEDPYSWFRAEVIVDGVKFDRAEIRKKGYIGSNDPRRPSLKLRAFQRSEKRESEADTAKLTTVVDLALNNNRQDPAMIRQYLAYEVFRRAGVPPPRCSFASVSVNGKDFGIYTVVEPINEAFLKQHFARSDGNLYEGGRSDFRSNWVQNFSIKKNGKSAGARSAVARSDLEAATAAIEQTSSSILPIVSAYFETGEFFRFWAVESLINANDGYSANMNNFYLYNDPSTGKFVFIPWGADATFNPGSSLNSVRGDPKSVIGVSILANRLYNSADGFSKYRSTLQSILKSAWNEEVLLREIDRLERLLAPIITAQPDAFRANVQNIRRFVSSRRAELEPELSGMPPTLKSKPLELAKRRKVGHFAGKFGLNADRKFSAEMSGTLWDRPLTFSDVSFQFQIDESEERRILQFMGRTESNQMYVISLAIDPDCYLPGKSISIDNTHIQGMFGSGKRYIGVLRGSLFLTKASKQDDELAGEFTVEVFSKLPKP